MADLWDEQDAYWRSNYNTRPYASGRSYDELRSGYRYGYDAADRYRGRSWDDVETDLSREWNAYEHRGQSTWETVKDAVKDAWARMTTGSASSTPSSGTTTYGSGASNTPRTNY
jgi:hypothetical protein